MIRIGKPGQEPMNTDRLLKFNDVREYLGIGRTKLHSMIRNREITSYMVAGQYRFEFKDVREWLDKQKLEAVSLI